MSVKFKITIENDYATAEAFTLNKDAISNKEIVFDPTILVTVDSEGFLSFINVEVCLPENYYTDYVTDVVNALIPGEYSVVEFAWTDVSAAELFVLLLMKGYNTTEYIDWTDALPDKGERIKQYFKSE